MREIPCPLGDDAETGTVLLKKYLPFLLVILAFLPVLSSHQTVDPDAQVILKNLSDLGGPGPYLRALLGFRTIDFQPVRDLTLSFDLFVYHQAGINTFIFQSILWWLASLVLVLKICGQLYPRIPELRLSLSVAAFGVYPLFSNVVSWGMNRKHLLALFFILLATRLVLERRQKWAPLCYALSVLSQPIHLLWPLFAVLTLRKSGTRTFYAALGILFLTLAMLNSYYYRTSETFHYFYPDKTMDFWNIPDKLLATGHYIFQMFFPYLLSFKYDLSHWSVLAGLVLLVLSLFLLWKSRSHKDLRWPVLAVLPLLIVLTDPFVLSDAYLLLPVTALFIFILPSLEKVPVKVIIPVALFWTSFSFIETRHWTNRVALARVSFERRPSCLSAVNYVKVAYDLYERPTDGLRYMEHNDCVGKMHVTPFFYTTMNILFAHYYFHEAELPLEKRIERLEALKEKHPYAHLSLIGLLIKEHREDEAMAEAEKFGNFWRDQQIPPDYHEITARFVHPFCVDKKIAACAAITSKLVRKETGPNL